MRKETFVLVSILLMLSMSAIAQVPQLINYQGMLSDADGNSITDTLSIEFLIYNSEDLSEIPLWSEIQDVAVIDGLFSILLGTVTPLPDSVFNGVEKYLGIKVGDDLEMEPRRRLVSVGYSFRSIFANRADTLGGIPASSFVQKIDGVSPDNSGDINLVAGSNISIDPDAANNSITISSSAGSAGGDITAVNAGNGLTDGGTSGDVTVNVGAGTGITVNSNDVALNTSYADGRYVNENQNNSISEAMLNTDAVTTNKIKNNAVTAAKISPDIVSSIDGVKNDGGNIDLVAGTGISINPDDSQNRITISASGSSGDNLGNHTATQNIKLNGKWLSGDGGNEGIQVSNAGDVLIPKDINCHGSVYVTNNIQANSDIIAVSDLCANGGYIRAGMPSHSYDSGDIAATDDVFADDDITAGDDVIANDCVIAGSPSTSYGADCVVASNDVIADDKVLTGSPTMIGTPGDIIATDDLIADDEVHVGDDLLVWDHAGINMNGGYSATYALNVFGNAYCTGSWLGSDKKFKKDILNIENPLSQLLKLNGVSYNWKTEEYKEREFCEGRHYGLIAQEVEKVLPDIVKTDEHGEKAIAYIELIPLLLEALKQQQKDIEQLQDKVNQYMNR